MKLVLIFLAISFCSLGYGQEICNNGLDDDGDGFVDQYDTDCPPTTMGTDNFGINSGCTTVPSSVPLSVASARSSAGAIMIYASPVVGDIDNDGESEIIALSDHSAIFSGTLRQSKDLLVINSSTGATNLTITTPFIYWSQFTPYAIADLDNDGFGEILVQLDMQTNSPADAGRLVCYSHTGAELWRTSAAVGLHSPIPNTYGNISVADIDQNGTAEVIIFDEIYNGQTGALLVRGPGGATGLGINVSFNNDFAYSLTVPADLTTHAGLELAAGKSVYQITISNTAGTVGNTMTAITLAGAIDGLTAVADMNRDGALELIVAEYGPNGKLYVWNPRTNTLMASVTMPTGVVGNIFNPVSAPFIGDMDNDCLPEIGITRRYRVFSYEYNGTATLSLKWQLVTTDDSGATGIVMFDFNQDGNQELVYRDQSDLRILNGAATGSSPTTVASFPCGSGTYLEHPVVADIDNDGSAELVCGCSGTGPMASTVGTIHIYESNSAPWAPARPVWNQEAYNSTNIRNNLGVPIVQQRNGAAYTTGACNCSAVGIGKQPFNNFGAQQTSLDDFGCAVFPGGDVALTTIVNYVQTTGQVIIKIDNAGDNAFPAGSSIAFYSGNPTTINAPLVSTGITPSVIAAHGTATFTFTVTPNLGYNLYVIISDNGSISRPFNLATQFPSTTFAECNYLNNMLHLTPPNFDTDGDGVDDLADLDDDNDGILDSQENGSNPNAMADADADGTPNYADANLSGFVDTNADGINDLYDKDLDGLINELDLDSDNDGIYDNEEAGHVSTDATNDGRVDGPVGTDGVPDAVQPSANSGTVNYTILNSDGTDTPNYLDGDSDNDGCTDADEGYVGLVNNADTDDNGYYGAGTPAVDATGKVTAASYLSTANNVYFNPSVNGCIDSDADAVPDIVDLDDDNDGILDVTEYCSPTQVGTSFVSGAGTGTVTGTLHNPSNSIIFNLTFVTSPDGAHGGIGNSSNLFAAGAQVAGYSNTTGYNNNLTITPTGAATFNDIVGSSIVFDFVDAGTYSFSQPLTGLVGVGGANVSLSANGKVVTVAPAGAVINNLGGFTAKFLYPIYSPFNLVAKTTMNDTYTYEFKANITNCVDSDGDGVVNKLDLDSDNDGVHDRVESGEISGADATNDGRVDGAVGTDGVPDAVQGLGQQNSGTVNYTLANTDGVDTPNFIDLDSDNDNCSDANEYYNLATADGGDGGVYGTGTPAVTPVGTVVAASYTGSYTTAINSRPASIAIGTQPSNQIITIGSAATFTVSASATTPSSPTIQWQESTNNGSTWNNVSNGGIYSGATTATLVINTPSAGMNGYDYRAVIHQNDHICVVLTSNSANLQINFPPVANDDNGGGLTEDGPNGTVNVITNDTDVDGNPTAPTNGAGQFTVDLDPGTPGIQTTFTDATGIWTYNGTTGIVTFDPANNYNGVATHTYELCDPTALCDQAIITFTVAPVNDPPVVDNEHHTINEDNTASGDLTDAGDSDPVEGTTLTANTTPLSGPAHGTITINPNGTYTYTPTANYNGTDQVIVSICDAGLPLPALCVNDTIFITINPVNDPPVVDNETNNTPQNTPVSGDLTDAGDSDPVEGTPLTANTTPLSGPAHGTITINPNGTYTYTPNPNYNGTDQVVVSICDAGLPLPALCVNDTIFISINPVNNPPVVDNEHHTINEDNTASGDLTDAGDSDPDGTTLTANTTPLSGPAHGTITINPNGTYTYTPTANYNGTDQVIVSICDAGLPLPAICVNDTIFITINPVNDPPVVDNEHHTINEDNTASGDLTDAGDSDPEGTTLTANTTPLSGPAHGTITINPNGTYTYTPTANYNGTDQVIVSICDAGLPLPAICVNDTIFITINPVNDPPVVDNETNNTPQNTPVSGDLTDAGDSDVDGNLVVTTTPLSGPSHGSITINPNGTYTYTPNTGFSGNDTVIVQICDDGTPLPVICVNDTIFINVSNVNDPPVLDNEHHVINEDNTASGDLTDAGDSDPEGTPLTANTTPVSGPAHGTITINPNGTYTYTPNPNYNGTDQVIVSICDAGLPLPAICVNDTIFITINPVNDAPVVDNESHNIPENTTASGDLTNAGDSDIDGNLVVTTTPLSGPAHGTITINPNGTYTYTPNTNYNGNDTVIVQICDDGTPLPAICVNDTIFITVSPFNDPPVVDNEHHVINEDNTASGDLTDAGDSDPDGNLVVNTTPLSGPSHGTITINPNGTYTYTPNPNYNGNDMVIVQICDDGTPLPAKCVNDTIFIIINPVNDPPLIDNEHHIVNVNQAASGDLTNGGDYDVDGNLICSTTPSSGPGHGTIVINADGTYTYTPANGYTGTDTVVVQVCDDGTPLPAICRNDTIFITVVGCDSPVDSDGDGLTDCEEITGADDPGTPAHHSGTSDPNDKCDPFPCSVSIPEAFTPDGDGHNDVFIIKGAEAYPDNELIIYNRWGNVVYQVVSYKNDWGGTCKTNMAVLGGTDLPTGTYYYIFDLKDKTLANNGVFKGFIYLKR